MIKYKFIDLVIVHAYMLFEFDSLWKETLQQWLSTISPISTKRTIASHRTCHSWLGQPLWNICVTNDHGYFPLVV